MHLELFQLMQNTITRNARRHHDFITTYFTGDVHPRQSHFHSLKIIDIELTYLPQSFLPAATLP